jgi:ribonuclease P protein component
VSVCAPDGNTNPPADSGKPAGFPRTARLLRHADFERVYKQGRRHFATHMTVFYLRGGEAQGLRVGFTVGRGLGGAVERNRMKRRLREAVRQYRRSVSAAADVVINPKKSLLRAEFTELLQEVERAFRTIQQKLGNEASGPERK